MELWNMHTYLGRRFPFGEEVSSMDDLEIIELYFARDELAIQQTDAKYGKLCHRIAYKILHNHEDSEECVNSSPMR